MKISKTESISLAEWRADAIQRFGPNPLDWKFVCPVCKHVAAVRDWKNAGAPEGAVAFSCIGRWTGGTGTMNQDTPDQPCNYAGGGFLNLNPVAVIGENDSSHWVFAFAEPEGGEQS